VTLGGNARAKVVNSLRERERETRTVGVLVDFWYKGVESHEATIYIASNALGTGLIFSA
jgi:hypothetical protein